jgi:HSP20 family protein
VADRPEIDRLSSEIEELFSELWQVPRFARTRGGFRPHVDCFRTDEPPELTVVVELPGVDPAEVEVVASPGSLVVSGERRRPAIPGRHYQQIELDYGRFQRRVALDPDIDITRARASYERGLLTVVMPVAPRVPRPQRVAIVVRTRS